MANQDPSLPLITVELPGSSGIPGEEEVEKVAQVTLPSQRRANERQQYIANRAKETIMIQIAVGGITAHGHKLIQGITMHAMQRFSEVVTYDRSLREITRDPVDEANVIRFNHAMLQLYTNSSVSASTTGIGKILDTILDADFNPPEDKEPQVVVEQEPGFFGKLFGGTKVTKVLR